MGFSDWCPHSHGVATVPSLDIAKYRKSLRRPGQCGRPLCKFEFSADD